MFNPIQFLRSVKQEALKISWPTRKETSIGALTVFAMSVIAALFFLLLDQIFKFGLNYLLGI
jgi:preprotein translocase subunit SecE